MGLHDLKHRMTRARVHGEGALSGDTLHLSRLRQTLHPLKVDPDLHFDRPLVVIAFTNRCGSTHLGQLLASAPDLYGFREDLNHNTVAKRAAALGVTDLTGYLRHIVDLNACPGAAFGLKASAEQLRLLRLTGIDRAFSNTTVIRIRRHDRVAQAVSLWMARRTWQWTSQQEAQDVPLTYDHHELRRHLESVQEAESALDLALSVLPYPVLSVEHETLCAHTASMIAALRAGLDLPECDATPTALIERQDSHEKAAIVARFRADLARHWSIANA